MAYKRRVAASITDSATTRLSAMEQIDTNKGVVTDYGGADTGPLTAVTLAAKLSDYDDKLSDYNKLLEQADSLANTLDDMEESIGADYTAVLKSATGKFGQNSNEIEMLGGTRKDERKKRTTKKKA